MLGNGGDGESDVCRVERMFTIDKVPCSCGTQVVSYTMILFNVLASQCLNDSTWSGENDCGFQD